jgi:GNAT superfamily N-acetyltransferase
MPTFIVKSPDGNKYRVNTPEGGTEDDAIAYVKRKFAPAKPQEEAGFFGSFGESAKEIFTGGKAARYTNVANASSDQEERNRLRREFLASQDTGGKKISFDEVDNLPEFSQWLRQTAGGSLGFLVAPAVAGTSAGAIAKLAGAATKTANPYARAAGYGTLGLQYLISNLGRQAQVEEQAVQEGKPVQDVNLGKAALGAGLQTAADVLQFELAFAPLVSKFPGMKNLLGASEAVAKKTVPQLIKALKAGELKLSNGVIRGIVGGMSFEIPQEIFQQGVERWNAGLSLTDESAKKEYLEAAVGAGILGGGAGAIQTTLGNRAEISEARFHNKLEQSALQSAQEERAQQQQDAYKAANTEALAQQQAATQQMGGTPTGRTRVSKAPGTGGKARDLSGYDTDATDLIKQLSPDGKETTPNQWHDALRDTFQLAPGEAGALLNSLASKNVINRFKDKNGLRNLYTPSITAKRTELLAKTNDEVNRIKQIASVEDLNTLTTILDRLDTTPGDNGKVKIIKGAEFEKLQTQLSEVLAKYAQGVADTGANLKPNVDENTEEVPAATTATEEVPAATTATEEVPAATTATEGAPSRGKDVTDAIDLIKKWGLPNDVKFIDAVLKSKKVTDEELLDIFKGTIGQASALKKLTEYKERLAKVLPNIPADEKFDTFHRGKKGNTEPATANHLASWLDARIKAQSTPKVRASWDNALLNDTLLTAEEVLAKYEGKPTATTEEAPAATPPAVVEEKKPTFPSVQATQAANTRAALEEELKKAEAKVEEARAKRDRNFDREERRRKGEENVEPNENIDVDGAIEAFQSANQIRRLLGIEVKDTTGKQESGSNAADASRAAKLSEENATVGDTGVSIRFNANDKGLDPRSVTAVDKDGNIVGSASVDEKGQNVANLEVDPKYRRKGIGTALFNRLREVHPTLGFGKTAVANDAAGFVLKQHENAVEHNRKVDELKETEGKKRRAREYKLLAEAFKEAGKVTTEIVSKVLKLKKHEAIAYLKEAAEDTSSPVEVRYDPTTQKKLPGYFLKEKFKPRDIAEEEAVDIPPPQADVDLPLNVRQVKRLKRAREDAEIILRMAKDGNIPAPHVLSKLGIGGEALRDALAILNDLGLLKGKGDLVLRKVDLEKRAELLGAPKAEPNVQVEDKSAPTEETVDEGVEEEITVDQFKEELIDSVLSNYVTGRNAAQIIAEFPGLTSEQTTQFLEQLVQSGDLTVNDKGVYKPAVKAEVKQLTLKEQMAQAAEAANAALRIKYKARIDEVVNNGKAKGMTKAILLGHLESNEFKKLDNLLKPLEEKALEKGKKAEDESLTGSTENFGKAKSGRLESRGGTTIVSSNRAIEIQNAIDGKGIDSVFNFLFSQRGLNFEKNNYLTSPYRTILKRVNDAYKYLQQNGVQFNFQVINDEKLANQIYGKEWAAGRVVSDKASNSITVYISGLGLGEEFHGMSPRILMHELIHAVTASAYAKGKTAMKGTKLRQMADDLTKLHKYLEKHLAFLAENGKLTKEEMNFLNGSNFLEDGDEVIAWALSSDNVMKMLEKIGYNEVQRGRAITVWDKIVDIIRSFLGMSPTANTALSEVLRLGMGFVEHREEGPAQVTKFKPVNFPAQTNAIGEPTRVWVAPAVHNETVDQTINRFAQQDGARLEPRQGLKEAIKAMFSWENWEKLIYNFQNMRRPLEVLSRYMDSAGLLEELGPKKNDINGEVTRSMAKAEYVLNSTMYSHIVDIDKAVDKYSKITGENKDKVLGKLHAYLMARHENERREVKYELNVPLNTKKLTTLDKNIVKNIMVAKRDSDGRVLRGTSAVRLDSVTASAADLRALIKGELDSNQNLVSNGYAETMRKALQELIRRNNSEFIDNTVDGSTPIKDVNVVGMGTNINDRIYDVAGAYSRQHLANIEDAYKREKQNPEIAEVLGQIDKSIKALQSAQIDADIASNYWSNQTSNRKAFYGWKNYVPFKGQGEGALSSADEELNFSGTRLGAGFQEVQGEFGGRSTDSENPLLQVMAEATKSALRYGRAGIMESLANLIDKNPKTGTRMIDGQKIKNIKFEERYLMIDNKDFSGPDKFFVYRDDGSIDIYKVNDQKIKEAIRKTFTDPNRLVDLANAITSGIGHLHTRYNVSFHPYNFVRDALTNAFTLGADFGPKQSMELISAVASRVAQSGMMTKAGKIALLYKSGKIDEIEKMAKSGDLFAKDALRYLQLGGRVTYLAGVDIREHGLRIKELNRGTLTQRKEAFDHYVDAWADSFELTSRVSSYGVLKNLYMAKGLSEQAAEIKAVNYAKNLANFEQVGKYGKEAGALFMFFRPAATGAVRAIDAISPAFRSWESYKKSIPKGITDPVQLAKIQEDFMARKKSAQAMAFSLMGAGAMMWTMAWMMADDDDIGRNKTSIDKMALWTRNIRLPMAMFGEKYKDTYLQMPWGFGLGAFGAFGAQVAGVVGGKTTIGESIPNMISISLDSYMPIPFERIDPTENPAAFIAGSIVPSVARPFVEYAMNVDSLGREIYNDRASRYGDAFTGGRNTPQLWKDAARMIFKVTNGEHDPSPDTMMFWANNYMDGASRIAQSMYGIGLALKDEKDISVKEDFAPLASFIGRASNYDGEKFAKLESDMQERSQRMKALERDRDAYIEYMERRPDDYMAVKQFMQNKNGWLKQLRSYRNQIEASNMTPKEKEKALEGIYRATGYVKRGMIEQAKAAGINP